MESETLEEIISRMSASDLEEGLRKARHAERVSLHHAEFDDTKKRREIAAAYRILGDRYEAELTKVKNGSRNP